MSQSDDAPSEPPRPEIDPSILRDLAREPSGAAESASQDASGTPAPDAPPSAALDDPELPGVSLATRVEALLFAASEPLPLRRLKELLRVEDGRAVREAVDHLAAEWKASRRAVRIDEVAGGFVVRTLPELAPLVARMGRKPEPEKLSAAALETLAIVAYRQPVLRADIERIRGVASGEVLRALVERGLVRVAGRADQPGAPLYYGTTGRFLEVFGLRDLAELPPEADARRG